MLKSLEFSFVLEYYIGLFTYVYHIEHLWALESWVLYPQNELNLNSGMGSLSYLRDL